MIGQVLGEVPEWVADGGSWVGLLVGLASLAALAYGFARWLRRSIVHGLGEIVDNRIDPLRDDIAASTAEARQVRSDLRTHMRVEEDLARESAEWRDSIDEWRTHVDLAFRNLQQDAADRATRGREEPNG